MMINQYFIVVIVNILQFVFSSVTMETYPKSIYFNPFVHDYMYVNIQLINEMDSAINHFIFHVWEYQGSIPSFVKSKISLWQLKLPFLLFDIQRKQICFDLASTQNRRPTARIMSMFLRCDISFRQHYIGYLTLFATSRHHI